MRMARIRYPAVWFEGGPLDGETRDKHEGGRWSTYRDQTTGAPVRTVAGDALARRRTDGEPVGFYRLGGDEVRRDGRFGRVYTHVGLLEERARRAHQPADAASDPVAVVKAAGEQLRAIREAHDRAFADPVPRFVEPRV